MGRKITTHFNPSLGIKYVVKDTKNGSKVIGKTLSPKSKEHLPVRSSRETPVGEEFFKMVIEGEVFKFMNSIQHDKCLSEDGRWEFTGLRPNGKKLESRKNKKSSRSIINESDLEFVSEDLKALLV
jgi:hypothetical protein